MTHGQNIAHVLMNKFMRFDVNSFNRIEIIATSVIFYKSKKGDSFIKLHCRVISLINVALVLVNMFMKFEKNSLSLVEVVEEIC